MVHGIRKGREKVNACQLRPEEQKLATEILHSVMDFERMGDHCIKLYDVAEYNRNEKITFSPIAKKELGLLSDAVYDADGYTLTRQFLEYGTVPRYVGMDPVKLPSVGYTYTFKGWGKQICEEVEKTYCYDKDGCSYLKRSP